MTAEDDPRFDQQEERPEPERTYIGDSLYVWWSDGNLMIAVASHEEAAGERFPVYLRPESVKRLRAFLDNGKFVGFAPGTKS